MTVYIDLNSDLGEQHGTSLDERIMPYISSCNIACGGHAGDEHSVEQTVDLAIKNGVEIGAHPGFPDKENFGRVVIDFDPSELAASITDQVRLVKRIAEKRGRKLHHVKPHGALYNLAARDAEVSKLIVKSIQSIDQNLKLYGLAHSRTEEIAKELGVPFVGESFADRRYESDKTLRSRTHDDGVITSTSEVLDQVESLTFHKSVSLDQSPLAIDSQTICLHSDTEGAVNLAKAIHDHLVSKGAIIRPV